MVIFIDDFHYMSKDVQIEVSRQIKEAIRHKVCIVCASVPYHSDDVIRSNPDLAGRITKIDFSYWDTRTLTAIGQKGFNALNLTVGDDFLKRFAKEAAGSPQLMQTLCLHICFEAGQREKPAHIVNIPSTDDFIRRICERASISTDYSSVTEKILEGPKTRGTNRTQYDLADGSRADVYPIVAKAISLDEPKLTFRYPELLSRIERVCGRDQYPSGSSVTGACSQIATLANDASNNAIVEWDGESDVLDIREPHLLFYLRWSVFPTH